MRRNEIDILWDEDAGVWYAVAKGVSILMAMGTGDSDRKAVGDLFERLRALAEAREWHLSMGRPARLLDRVDDLLRREDELVTGLFAWIDGDEPGAGVLMFDVGEEEAVTVVMLLHELVHEVRGVREDVAGLRAGVAEMRRPRRIRMGPEGMSITSWPPEDWGPIVETLREMGWG